MAYVGKFFDKASCSTYCLVGDGEGNIWVAFNFVRFYNLDNLCAFLDIYRKRLDSFGFHTYFYDNIENKMNWHKKAINHHMNLGPSDAVLYINGMHYDMEFTDIFTTMDADRQEDSVLGGLGKLGLDHKQTSALMAVDLAGNEVTYDAVVRDSDAGFNNIKKDSLYKEWPDSVKLLRPTVIWCDPSKTKSKALLKNLEIFYVHKVLTRIGLVFSVNTDQDKTGDNDAGAALVNAYKCIAMNKEPSEGLVEEVGEDSECNVGRKIAGDFVLRTGLGQLPQVYWASDNKFLNGKDFEEGLLTELMKKTQTIHREVYKKILTDEHDLLDWLMARLKRIVDNTGTIINMVSDQLNALNTASFSKLDKRSMAAAVAKHMKYLVGKDPNNLVTTWVLADLDTEEGRAVVTAAAGVGKTSTQVRLGYGHNNEELGLMPRAVQHMEHSADFVFTRKIHKEDTVKKLKDGKLKIEDYDINGKVVGLFDKEAFTVDDMDLLEKLTMSRYGKNLVSAFLDVNDKAMLVAGQLITRPSGKVWHEIVFRRDKHSIINLESRFPDKPDFDHLVAIANPVSRGAQKILPFLLTFWQLGVGIDRTVVFVSSFADFLSRAFNNCHMAVISLSNLNLVSSHCVVSIGEDRSSQLAPKDFSMFSGNITGLKLVENMEFLHDSLKLLGKCILKSSFMLPAVFNLLNTFRIHRIDVPAARLVCVEVNPGPTCSTCFDSIAQITTLFPCGHSGCWGCVCQALKFNGRCMACSAIPTTIGTPLDSDTEPRPGWDIEYPPRPVGLTPYLAIMSRLNASPATPDPVGSLASSPIINVDYSPPRQVRRLVTPVITPRPETPENQPVTPEHLPTPPSPRRPSARERRRPLRLNDFDMSPLAPTRRAPTERRGGGVRGSRPGGGRGRGSRGQGALASVEEDNDSEDSEEEESHTQGGRGSRGQGRAANDGFLEEDRRARGGRGRGSRGRGAPASDVFVEEDNDSGEMEVEERHTQGVRGRGSRGRGRVTSDGIMEEDNDPEETVDERHTIPVIVPDVSQNDSQVNRDNVRGQRSQSGRSTPSAEPETTGGRFNVTKKIEGLQISHEEGIIETVRTWLLENPAKTSKDLKPVRIVHLMRQKFPGSFPINQGSTPIQFNRQNSHYGDSVKNCINRVLKNRKAEKNYLRSASGISARRASEIEGWVDDILNLDRDRSINRETESGVRVMASNMRLSREERSSASLSASDRRGQADYLRERTMLGGPSRQRNSQGSSLDSTASTFLSQMPAVTESRLEINDAREERRHQRHLETMEERRRIEVENQRREERLEAERQAQRQREDERFLLLASRLIDNRGTAETVKKHILVKQDMDDLTESQDVFVPVEITNIHKMMQDLAGICGKPIEFVDGILLISSNHGSQDSIKLISTSLLDDNCKYFLSTVKRSQYREHIYLKLKKK